jgi:hypothetical protein
VYKPTDEEMEEFWDGYSEWFKGGGPKRALASFISFCGVKYGEDPFTQRPMTEKQIELCKKYQEKAKKNPPAKDDQGVE